MTELTQYGGRIGVDVMDLLHSPEMERSTIGCVLNNPETFKEIKAEAMLEPGDFHIIKYGWVWEVFEYLVGNGDAIDFKTVAQRLSEQSRLAEVGGAAELLAMVAELPSSVHAATYARKVKRHSSRRSRMAVLSREAELTADLSLTEAELAEKVDEVRSSLPAMTTRQHKTARELASEFWDGLDKKVNRYLITGHGKIDSVLRDSVGINMFSVLQGVTGFGKTWWAAWLAMQWQSQVPILYLSFETSDDVLTDRMISMLCGAEYSQVRDRSYPDRTKLLGAVDAYGKMNIDIIDGLVDLPQIDAAIQQWILRNDFKRGMVIVDNLNNLAEARPGGADTSNFSYVGAWLMAKQREYGVGMLVLAQQRADYNSSMTGNDAITRAFTPTKHTLMYDKSVGHKARGLIGFISPDKINEDFIKNPRQPYIYEGTTTIPQGHVMLMNCKVSEGGAKSAVVRFEPWHGVVDGTLKG